MLSLSTLSDANKATEGEMLDFQMSGPNIRASFVPHRVGIESTISTLTFGKIGILFLEIYSRDNVRILVALDLRAMASIILSYPANVATEIEYS